LNGPNIAKPAGGDQGIFSGLPTFIFAVGFSATKQACGPEANALRGKSIGPAISDFGLWISDFILSFSNPHSAIYNPQFGGAPTMELPCRWEKDGLPARSRK
jgi:hypothetical protein